MKLGLDKRDLHGLQTERNRPTIFAGNRVNILVRIMSSGSCGGSLYVGSFSGSLGFLRGGVVAMSVVVAEHANM